MAEGYVLWLFVVLDAQNKPFTVAYAFVQSENAAELEMAAEEVAAAVRVCGEKGRG